MLSAVGSSREGPGTAENAPAGIAACAQVARQRGHVGLERALVPARRPSPAGARSRVSPGPLSRCSFSRVGDVTSWPSAGSLLGSSRPRSGELSNGCYGRERAPRPPPARVTSLPPATPSRPAPGGWSKDQKRPAKVLAGPCSCGAGRGRLWGGSAGGRGGASVVHPLACGEGVQDTSSLLGGGGLGVAMAPSHLSVREMREDEKPLVLEMLTAGVKDTENRVALHALTRPPALLLLAAASSGLRFVLASFALALLLPVFLAVAAVKLGLRARWGSLPPPGGLGGPWVAVRGSGDVCGVLALAPGTNVGDGARVTRLSVSRWHRRRGVGRRLLAFAEARARAWAGGMGETRARLVVPVAVATWGVAGMLEGCGYQADGGWGCLGYTLVREFSKDL
ncbi:N-acetyltransferase 14 [Plecturocebus cupreus]